MPKPIYVIAAKASGTPANGVEDVRAALKQHNLEYKLKIVSTPAKAYEAAAKVDKKKYGALAVFGGDGTVIQVFKATYKQRIPILVLPGGTANALAKGIGMPKDIDSCIGLYSSGIYQSRYHNVGLINGKPFMLDLHIGIMADALKNTPSKHKKMFGQLAYGFSVLKQLRNPDKQTYELSVDGEKKTLRGYACVVANEGEHSILGMPLFPWPKAGAVNVAVIRTLKVSRWIAWFMIRSTSGRNLQSVVSVWRAREAIIHQAPQPTFIDDDTIHLELPLNVNLSPYSVVTIAPPTEEKQTLEALVIRAKVALYRYYDHAKRLLLGVPSRNYCQVSPHLYVGGTYRGNAASHFRRWGITGIVSMQERVPAIAKSEHMDVLHLPTPDHTPPTLESFTKGVAFIKEHTERGGSVYVHCNLGEGRGPSMAIAYLMSKGVKLEDAINSIRKFRPFVRPNRRQLRQLVRWGETQPE